MTLILNFARCMMKNNLLFIVFFTLLSTILNCSAMEHKTERSIIQEWEQCRYKTHTTSFEELRDQEITSLTMDETGENIILVSENPAKTIYAYHPVTKKLKIDSSLRTIKNSREAPLSIDITGQDYPTYITPSALGTIFKMCYSKCVKKNLRYHDMFIARSKNCIKWANYLPYRFYEQYKIALARGYYTSSSDHDFSASDNQGCILMKTIKDEITSHTLCSMYIDDNNLNFSIKPLCMLIPSKDNNEKTYVSPDGTLVAHYNNKNQELTIFSLLEPGFTFGSMHDTNFAYH